jgi:hypothetical protein
MWAAQLSGMLFLAQERSIYLRGTVTVYFKITKFSGESCISATTLHSLDFKKKKISTYFFALYGHECGEGGHFFDALVSVLSRGKEEAWKIVGGDCLPGGRHG